MDLHVEKTTLRRKFKNAIVKFRGVNVRTKVIGIVLACITVSSLSLIWFVNSDSKTALTRAAQQTADSLVLNLSSLIDGFSPDNSMLGVLMDTYVRSDDNIHYLYLADRQGNVLARASTGTIPSMAARELTAVAAGDVTLHHTSLTIDNAEVIDVASSVSGGATLHLGLAGTAIQQIVATHIQHIMLWMIVVVVLGVSVAVLLSRELTSGLARLAEEAKSLGRGKLWLTKRQWDNDEIGSLARTFEEISREIHRKEQMRQQLLAQVLTAQEAERKRIARELHDDTSQSLTSLMLELKAIEKADNIDEVRQRLSGLRSCAHQTLEGVHHMAMELRPNVLDDLGLRAALHKYITEFSRKTGIKVDLQYAGGEMRRLPSDVETAAYRVAQEALANVVRHAHARNANVVVNFREDKFTMVVEDDGQGFDVDEAMQRSPEHKLGLFGMYERASLVGGTLNIESAPGEGTSVFLEIPVRNGEIKDG
jgi:signal transduction histidine kinase